MSDVKEHNQALAKKTKKILEGLGYKIPLGHSYELVSKLAGFPNWDTASASNKMLLKDAANVELDKKPETPNKDKKLGLVESTQEFLGNTKSEEPTVEDLLNFKPRSAVNLKKDLIKIMTDFLKEDGEPNARKTAKDTFEDIAYGGDMSNVFLLFDALGNYDKDKELELIYSMASEAFVRHAQKNPDLYLNELLCESLETGMNIEDHLKFIESRKTSNFHV